VTAYEALYGHRPADKPAPGGGGAPLRFEPILRRGLATSTEARWPTMRALLEALEEDPGLRRRRLLAIVVVTIAIAIALVAAGLQMWMFARWMGRI
jgi:hypothetical protein